MSNQPHILFTYGCPPRQGFGSPIIVDRHLKRIPAAWTVSLACPEQSFHDCHLPNGWQSIPIPSRRWWWLPYRKNISLSMRFRFYHWMKECERTLDGKKPTAILTVLHDMFSVFGAYLSKEWKIPLNVIVHDRDELFAKSAAEHNWIVKNWAAVLEQADRVWTVSPELADVYKIADIEKTKTLLPIPSKMDKGFSSWQEKYKTAPVVGYAGNIYPSQAKCFRQIAAVLEKVNGTLLLVTPKSDESVQALIDSFPNVEHHDPFPNNSDAVRFLRERASCVLVYYTFTVSELPWSQTSFPSKLIEFSSLGLPTIVLSPESTALGNWAKSSNWHSYLSQFDENKLLEIFEQLMKQSCWMKMASQTKRAAMTEFNGDSIHSQFESELVLLG